MGSTCSRPGYTRSRLAPSRAAAPRAARDHLEHPLEHRGVSRDGLALVFLVARLWVELIGSVEKALDGVRGNAVGEFKQVSDRDGDSLALVDDPFDDQINCLFGAPHWKRIV